MASSGPNSPTAAANMTLAGSSGTWTNPTNVYAAEGTYASGPSVSSGQYSDLLFASGFGFSIPGGSTIDGLYIEWRTSSNFGSIQDQSCRAVKGGATAGTDKAVASDWSYGGSFSYRTYGGAADLWGTTWSVAEINASDFGAALAMKSMAGGVASYIDHVRITVYYTAGAAGGMVIRRRQSRTLRRM